MIDVSERPLKSAVTHTMLNKNKHESTTSDLTASTRPTSHVVAGLYGLKSGYLSSTNTGEGTAMKTTAKSTASISSNT